ncbi:Dipeptide transport system permease protein DppB [Calidithermus terrae]|uniref:Dipeptide transport system permease protein DppB n=1 Tax=Calidithermus terrae TaxID=1408545 RepID=A0A399EK69_9DEIN|nr:ABC transporter permease [Calidithermus terrae]RIH83863.1 Dipeptide transport system permease protein DppB [Calidithermus terrae]
MWNYIARRFLQLIPTFVGATILAFVIIQIAPGDAITRFELDPTVEREQIERLRQQFGLDQPVPVQYAKWLSGVLFQGYLGISLDYRSDVWSVIRQPILNSMVLVVLSTLLIFAVAIPIGVYSAVRKYSLGDRTLTFLAFFGLAIPNFFFGLIMLYFAIWVNDNVGRPVLPIGGMTSQEIGGVPYLEAPWWQRTLDVLWHSILPVIVLSTSGMAGLVRIMRGQMLEVLSQDFVRTARAKGVAERMVIYKHALRNAVIPIVAGIGGLLPGLIAGAGLVEVVMAWPGITPAFLQAVSAIDIYVIMGLITISTFLLIIGNLISDLLLAWVDPRIRYN